MERPDKTGRPDKTEHLVLMAQMAHLVLMDKMAQMAQVLYGKAHGTQAVHTLVVEMLFLIMVAHILK
jgi:hypothetical protein